MRTKTLVTFRQRHFLKNTLICYHFVCAIDFQLDRKKKDCCIFSNYSPQWLLNYLIRSNSLRNLVWFGLNIFHHLTSIFYYIIKTKSKNCSILQLIDFSCCFQNIFRSDIRENKVNITCNLCIYNS